MIKFHKILIFKIFGARGPKMRLFEIWCGTVFFPRGGSSLQILQQVRAQVRAEPKIFWRGKESMCAPARKIFGVRATMRALQGNFKMERFFKISTFFKNPNRQSAPERCEVDQLQKFFQKLIIFHLDSVRAKSHLVTPNTHEVRGGVVTLHVSVLPFLLGLPGAFLFRKTFERQIFNEQFSNSNLNDLFHFLSLSVRSSIRIMIILLEL